MTQTTPHTPFFEASRPLEIAQAGRTIDEARRTAFEEVLRTPLQDERRTRLAQARAFFAKLENHPEEFATQEEVTAAEEEIKELIRQAGVGNDIATLDITRQTTTREMQARFDRSIRKALDYIQNPAPVTPVL
jgi:hypothetical protein